MHAALQEDYQIDAIARLMRNNGDINIRDKEVLLIFIYYSIYIYSIFINIFVYTYIGIYYIFFN